MSAATPIAAGMRPAVSTPSAARIAMNTSVDGAKRKPMLTPTKEASDRRIRGRRPMRSARDPITGEANSAPRAKAIVMIPRASTPEPNSLSLRAKTGMISPKPVITMPTLAASRRMMWRARRGSGREVITRSAITTWPRFGYVRSGFTLRHPARP